jgi:hypothetical protein
VVKKYIKYNEKKRVECYVKNISSSKQESQVKNSFSAILDVGMKNKDCFPSN